MPPLLNLKEVAKDTKHISLGAAFPPLIFEQTHTKKLLSPTTNSYRMQIIDIIILVPILYGLILGIFRGLVAELTAIVALIAGIVCAKVFAPDVAQKLTTVLTWDVSMCEALAYVIVFFVVALSLTLVGKLLTRLFRAISLAWLNRLLGAVFGALKWLLAVSVILVAFDLLDNTLHILKPEIKEQSICYEPVRSIASIAWDEVQNLSAE